MAAALFVLYSVTAVRAHQRLLSTGFDLGIFEQVVRSYAEGGAGVTEIKGPGFRQLGDHFSPILVLLAPVYRILPSPVTLLIAQAGLLAVAVVPLAGWAQRALGRVAAVVVGLGYGLSWGIAQAVGFDFHEVAFAVPLLAMSTVALGERRWRAAAGWALPLLLVKEDLGLTVVAIGLLIAGYGARRLGLAVAAAGALGTVVTVTVLLPALNPGGGYAYTPTIGGREWSGLLAPVKVGTLLMVLVPTAFAALRSPLALIAVPTLAWRFASENPYYWGTGFHYSAVLMPVMFAALIDALVRVKADGRPATRIALAVVVTVSLLLLPRFPLAEPFRAETWRADPRIAAARRVLDRIPDGATVAASNGLAPQLTGRTTVTLFGLRDGDAEPGWIVVDLRSGDTFPLSAGQRDARVAAARASGYRVIADEAGFLLLRWEAPGSP
jgi:uncharacterized membrane protein